MYNTKTPFYIATIAAISASSLSFSMETLETPYMKTPKAPYTQTLEDPYIEPLEFSFQKKAPKFNIFKAITKHKLDILEELVQDGVDVNLKNDDENTPLLLACETGDTEIVEYLLENGANKAITIACKGFTPLIKACFNGKETIVGLLLQYGKILEYRRNLQDNFEENFPVNVNNLQVNMATDNDETPLLFACINGNETIARLLLPYCTEATINKANKQGFTPLIYACNRESINIVKRLLEQKADCNKAGSDGTTPLYFACIRKNTCIVKLLLKYGAIVDEKSIEMAKKYHLEEIMDLITKNMPKPTNNISKSCLPPIKKISCSLSICL